MADSTPQTLDLTPEIISLEVQQATDVTIEFQLTDNTGTGVDLSLDSVKFTAKDAYAGTVKIATKGQHIQECVNGEKTVDIQGERATKGYIGLQNHDARSVVKFRNVRVTGQ